MAKILLVEDEIDLAYPVKDWLMRDKYLVEISDNGIDALDKLRVYKYDLIILDWMIPGNSGIEVCKRFRENGGSTPILLLTAKSQISDKETGLDAGADDYLTKPFHLKELSARVRALLRRHIQSSDSILKAGNVSIDTLSRKVTVDGTVVHLVPKEYSLLEFFMRHPNQVFSAEALIDRVWASDTMASADTIRTYIKLLRKKLGNDDEPSNLLRTVHGVGYKLEC
jgi:DNA-binding response OmpR family regulator